METNYKKILYTTADRVARITLNRPDKRNALDSETIAELENALATAAAEPEIRVILLTGAGKDFCSGADLDELAQSFDNGPLENIAGARKLANLFLAMRNHRCPIVAAVRGRALAGGCGLATACDMILAAESAQFGYPEVNIGFVPAMVMAILRRSVPEKRALEWILSGNPFTARAAFDAGLVNQVYATGDFDSSVDKYLGHLASRSSSAVAISKHLLYHMDAMSFEAALEAGAQTNAIARMTEDCREGIRRFLKK